MSCRLEPIIWSCDTGQQIPCFDRCQLMSNIKEVHRKPRLHVSVKILFFGVWCHVEWLHHRHRHRRHSYAPTSNPAAHYNHEKINSWVSFSLYGYWAPLGGPSGCQSSASIVWSQDFIRNTSTSWMPQKRTYNLNTCLECLECWFAFISTTI